ncbi:MAG: hypothetical protein WAV32_05300 [Halobacteriota archaeon]
MDVVLANPKKTKAIAEAGLKTASGSSDSPAQRGGLGMATKLNS